MNKEQMVQLLMLLSAMESWAMSSNKPLPQHLQCSLDDLIYRLSRQVIDAEESQKQKYAAYRHNRTGNEYLVHSSKHKQKMGMTWYDAVLYENEKGETFSRACNDFHEAFTEVEP